MQMSKQKEWEKKARLGCDMIYCPRKEPRDNATKSAQIYTELALFARCIKWKERGIFAGLHKQPAE